MTRTAKFAGAQVVFFFAVEDEDGDVDNVPTQPITVKAKEWRNGWSSEASTALIAGCVAQLEAATPSEPEPSDDGHQPRRRAPRKK